MEEPGGSDSIRYIYNWLKSRIADNDSIGMDFCEVENADGDKGYGSNGFL